MRELDIRIFSFIPSSQPSLETLDDKRQHRLLWALLFETGATGRCGPTLAFAFMTISAVNTLTIALQYLLLLGMSYPTWHLKLQVTQSKRALL